MHLSVLVNLQLPHTLGAGGYLCCITLLLSGLLTSIGTKGLFTIFVLPICLHFPLVTHYKLLLFKSALNRDSEFRVEGSSLGRPYLFLW